MAFTSISDAPPNVIDDDIQRTIKNILKVSSNDADYDIKIEGHDVSQQSQQQLSEIPQARLFKILCSTLQVERNGWKVKLHTTLQEIDKHNRAAVTVQSRLQELADQLGIGTEVSHKRVSSSKRQSADLIADIQAHAEELLKQQKTPSSQESSKETHFQQMQISVHQLEKVKAEQADTIQKKTEEIQWLQKELSGIKTQLHKLRRIVLRYNESHSSNFHLDVTKGDGPKPDTWGTTDRKGGSGQGQSTPLSSERTYVEGDQLDYFATPAEEIALWKLRSRQNGGSETGRGRGSHRSKAGIARCLRCQQLFKANENNVMACRYHKKGREIREQYDSTGRLSKVVYKWACCRKGLDVLGCAYGYHI